ncbi:MAG TPA: CAP domain-containing protein [Ilumatobacteraceae bacterium]|nr:CAP domain-containing protein [Ilumatobacteraceae bacterium]
MKKSHENQSRRSRFLGAGLGVVAATFLASTAYAASPSPSYIPPTADWLTTVNYYRTMSGVSPVVEDPAMSAGAALHSCYMLYNGIAHDEVPGLTGYTPEGDAAGNSGNVAVSSAINTSARSHVELWMTGPFHAIGVLRPNLRSSGFGRCDLTDTPTWHSGATLDVLRGLGSTPRPSNPILFPGDGTTTNLDHFVVESPNPLTYCNWTGNAGLPIIAMMPEAATNASATLVGPNGPIQVCVLSAANTSGVAQQILQGDNAVIIVPRTVLPQGAFSVSASTNARTVNWTFNVDSAAALGVGPAPVAEPSAPATGFAPLPPARIVDTRTATGATRLGAQSTVRIQITRQGGVPTDAKAVLANATVTQPSGPGFLTLWNCSDTRPEVSTLNYSTDQTVANTATIPLDSTGGLCAFSSVSADLVIDIGGYYSSSATGRYQPLSPRRLMDSREGIGTASRLTGGHTVELSVAGVAGIPANASAVALNVTGILPSTDGFVTAFPCGAMPSTSSLNPTVGRITPNLVMAQMSSKGAVCLFTNADVDLVVDAVGFVSPTTTNRFTPSTPFRFTDTRDTSRLEVNAGQSGMRMAQGQILTIQMAGARGIPSNAKAISANLTAVDAVGGGFLTAFPCGDVPTASNVNFEFASPVANAAELSLSASGALCVYTSTSAQVIIDVNGWWS